MNVLLHPRTERALDMFLTRPAHALGLSGPTGAGKDYLCRYIVVRLLDISPERVENYQYLFMLDAQAGEGIEKIRELQAFLSLKVPGSKPIRRVVIVRLPETFRPEAQNALLKTLEEPPEDTILICSVSAPQQLLPTVSSRLQWVQVLPILRQQAEVAFPHVSKSELARAFHISEGYSGLLSALLEANAQHPLVSAIDRARELLRMPTYARLARIEEITKDKEYNISNLLNALYKLLHAATAIAASQADIRQADLTRLNRQTDNVLRAQELLEAKVQPKLVLCWLFYSL